MLVEFDIVSLQEQLRMKAKSEAGSTNEEVVTASNQDILDQHKKGK